MARGDCAGVGSRSGSASGSTSDIDLSRRWRAQVSIGPVTSATRCNGVCLTACARGGGRRLPQRRTRVAPDGDANGLARRRQRGAAGVMEARSSPRGCRSALRAIATLLRRRMASRARRAGATPTPAGVSRKCGGRCGVEDVAMRRAPRIRRSRRGAACSRERGGGTGTSPAACRWLLASSHSSMRRIAQSAEISKRRAMRGVHAARILLRVSLARQKGDDLI